MTAVPLRLPTRVAMMPSSKAMERLARDRAQGRGTDPDRLARELTLLSFGGGVPARVDENGDEPRLLLYTERYVLWLYNTDFGNGYRLGHVEPINLKDHERLLSGALLLQGPGWQAFQNLEDIPENSSSHWELIAGTWQTAGAEPEPSGPPPHHQRYLDLVAEVVEATRTMEVTKQGATRPLRYRHVDTARKARDSASTSYTFHLLRPSTLGPGSPVQVGDDPELRGTVIRAESTEVVVRFNAGADCSRIRAEGTLQLVPSEHVYQTQLDAIDLLRQRRAANPNLMTALIDHQLAYFQPDRDAFPRLPLDSGQLEALQRALTVPDVLLVLGPPGTGKTRTITEIATASAALGRPVLVTAHTNRAVDNVLQDLSGRLRCVRVGDEDAMPSHARHFTVQAQVDELKENVLRATGGTASRLDPVSDTNGPVHLWLNFLETRLAEARTSAGEKRRCREALAAVSQRVSAPMRDRIQEAETALTKSRATVSKLERAVVRRRRRQERAAARAASADSFQDLYRWLADRSTRRRTATEQQLTEARTSLTAAETASAAVQAEVRVLVGQDEEGAQLIESETVTQAAMNSALVESSRAMAAIRSDLRGVLDLPDDDPTDLTEWERFASAVRRRVTALHQKASLLAQWRARVPEAEQALQSELVRFADVVAATCVGAATTDLLSELDFDLAIVNEAGQISLPSVLVPLVRARRAVLVGDHHQLPPFLDDDVDQWAKRLTEDRDATPAPTAEIGKILRKSAFEGLFDVTGPDHRVPLTVQRRMPEPLAEFISQSFYGGVLQTEHPGTAPDPVFSSALALVDTEDRPPALRSERRADHDEEWNLPGYVNELEATVITNLITQYVRHYDDWAVIVPYRAQAFRIRKLLTEQLGDAGRVEDNVATVDSFQGGERDLVVFGFTRSNQTGDVGFLKELRRINVAMTRTKQQLVLVGDTSTLLQANDKDFAELMKTLDEHLREHGDIRRSRELEAELKRLAGSAS